MKVERPGNVGKKVNFLAERRKPSGDAKLIAERREPSGDAEPEGLRPTANIRFGGLRPIGYFLCIMFFPLSLVQAAGDTPRTINMRLTPTWVSDDVFHYERETIDGRVQKVTVNARSGESTAQSARPRGKSKGLVGGRVPHSNRDGPPTSLTFVNGSDQTVTLCWVDAGGGRQPYDVIEPGETVQRRTYAGHVWEVIGKDGAFFGSTVARLSGGPCVIDQEFEKPTKSSPGRPRLKSDAQSPKSGPLIRVNQGHLQLRRDRQSQWQTLPLDRNNDDTRTLVLPEVSPDGSVAIVWVKTEAEKPLVHRLESSPTGGGRAKLLSVPYALPGDPVDSYELVCLDTSTKQRLPIDIPTMDFLKPKVRWWQGHKILLQKVERGHQRFRLLVIDPVEGTVQSPIDETTETFIWTSNSPHQPIARYLLDSDAAIYSSEISGWRHLYWVDLTGRQTMRPITRGEWVVRDVVSVNEDCETVDLMVSGIDGDQDPYHRHLIRIGFDGQSMIRLTDGDGDHQVQFSPSGEYLIDSYSRIDMPPVHELRRTADGSLVETLEVAERLINGEKSLDGLPTIFDTKGRDGETDIWGFISFPPGFDESSDRQYPILESIYAGPQDSHVPKRYTGFAMDAGLTEAGFVVVRIDGMGTANRSKAFHDVCWHNLKDAGLPDRIAWIKAAADRYSAMDLDRVGVFGTSAGGQNACGALLFHNDFYKAAVASCGCHDNRMDKLIWNEQWMGYPVGDQYVESSNIEHADRLEGDLMLLVGELDANVPPESTYRLVDALIRADKTFDFLMIPGVGHGSGGKYGRRRMRDFFKENLK